MSPVSVKRAESANAANAIEPSNTSKTTPQIINTPTATLPKDGPSSTDIPNTPPTTSTTALQKNLSLSSLSSNSKATTSTRPLLDWPSRYQLWDRRDKLRQYKPVATVHRRPPSLARQWGQTLQGQYDHLSRQQARISSLPRSTKQRPATKNSHGRPLQARKLMKSAYQ